MASEALSIDREVPGAIVAFVSILCTWNVASDSKIVIAEICDVPRENDNLFLLYRIHNKLANQARENERTREQCDVFGESSHRFPAPRR